MLSDALGLVGQKLDGPIRVERVEGEGALSLVYSGYHEALGARVAIKCLNLPSTLDDDLARPFRDSFQHACRLHFRLSQGNLAIARTLATGTTAAPATGAVVPYLVRDWYEGRALAKDLEERRARDAGGRSVHEAVQLLSPAAQALAFAHGQGVVHHHFHPSNLFLADGPDGISIRVLDFGVAKVVHEHSSSIAQWSPGGALRLFFPGYAAPEQLDARVGLVGPASDVYALVLVLLELMLGRPVLPIDSPAECIRRTLDPADRPTPSRLGLALSAPVERVLARGVALLPSERPSDAGELWEALNSALRASITSEASGLPLAQVGSSDGTAPHAVPLHPAPSPATTAEPAGTAGASPSRDRMRAPLTTVATPAGIAAPPALNGNFPWLPKARTASSAPAEPRPISVRPPGALIDAAEASDDAMAMLRSLTQPPPPPSVSEHTRPTTPAPEPEPIPKAGAAASTRATEGRASAGSATLGRVAPGRATRGSATTGPRAAVAVPPPASAASPSPATTTGASASRTPAAKPVIAPASMSKAVPPTVRSVRSVLGAQTTAGLAPVPSAPPGTAPAPTQESARSTEPHARPSAAQPATASPPSAPRGPGRTQVMAAIPAPPAAILGLAPEATGPPPRQAAGGTMLGDPFASSAPATDSSASGALHAAVTDPFAAPPTTPDVSSEASIGEALRLALAQRAPSELDLAVDAFGAGLLGAPEAAPSVGEAPPVHAIASVAPLVPARSRKTWLLVAAAAFATVGLGGLALVLVTRSGAADAGERTARAEARALSASESAALPTRAGAGAAAALAAKDAPPTATPSAAATEVIPPAESPASAATPEAPAAESELSAKGTRPAAAPHVSPAALSQPLADTQAKAPDGPAKTARKAASSHSGLSTAAAHRALDVIDGILASCKRPGGIVGQGQVRVNFTASGAASSAVVVGPPFSGTPEGKCIESRFRAARVDPFQGPDVTVTHPFKMR